jgi:hypothetical protein
MTLVLAIEGRVKLVGWRDSRWRFAVILTDHPFNASDA